MFSSLALTLILLKSVLADVGPGVHQLTAPCDHGEGPTWDDRTGLLFFVDIHNGGIISYDIDNGQAFSINIAGDVTPVIQTRHSTKEFVAGVNKTLALVKWDGKSPDYNVETIASVDDGFPDSRFNDGKADTKGRLWIGTMGFENEKGEVRQNEGKLYLFSKNNLKTPQVMISPVTVSNGLTWNKENNKFYYIDTPSQKIMQYDYHENAKPSISNPQVVVDLKKELGDYALPDGMTIDVDGDLWVALFGGGAVIRVNPAEKRVVQTIAMPARYITSVMWGGEDFDILFVTTSRVRLNEAERLISPGAGALFAITNLDTNGFRTNEADVF